MVKRKKRTMRKSKKEWLKNPPNRWKTSCIRTERIEDPNIDAEEVCIVIWKSIGTGEKARIIQANSPYSPKEER